MDKIEKIAKHYGEKNSDGSVEYIYYDEVCERYFSYKPDFDAVEVWFEDGGVYYSSGGEEGYDDLSYEVSNRILDLYDDVPVEVRL